jgi:hypothetical protein
MSAENVSNETGPPETPDHGLEPATFYRLWSLDTDEIEDASSNGTGTDAASNVTETDSAFEHLGAGTDLPFDSPPRAVERWNRGDHAEFTAGNRETSVHPPDADLSSGVVLKDAYIEAFAIQPSTRARLSPGETPHYVAPDGEVLATVDYRLDAPAFADATVEWETRIETVRLLVDGRVESSTGGSHTPTLTYEDLAASPGEQRRLTLVAEITATPEVVSRACERTNRSCANTTDPDVSSERLVVRDSVSVTVYDLSVSGFHARYPDGDTGLVLYKNQPWLGYRFPGGDVRGVWRFYTARDTEWDRLVASTDAGDRVISSPAVPLRTYAYPIETGPTPSPRETVRILRAYGTETEAPALPAQVRLDTLERPYNASFGIATRIEADATPPFGLTDVRALGLVRGVTATPSDPPVRKVPIRSSNLTLTVRNRSEATVTISASLTDARTGAPIETRERPGALSIAGRSVETNESGVAGVTLPRDGSVTARFEPGPWWESEPGYTASSDVIHTGGAVLRLLETLYRIAVPVSLFLGAVFLTDRITGWGVWPPWRRL